MQLTRKEKQWINNKLNSLEKSKFRASFHLNKKMIEYIDIKGLELVESHCNDFIDKNLKTYNKEKDGKQTPTKNHPVFVAQHATATCCRGCIEKWYHIPKEKVLQENEIKCIKAMIMEWIKKEYSTKKEQ